MELQIINSRNQIIDVIKLENYYHIDFQNSLKITTINNCYLNFVYHLEEPVQNVINNHPFVIKDNDVIFNTKIQDCCLVITKLKNFLKKDNYYVKVIEK